MEGKITVRELEPEMADDYLAFFDEVYDHDKWLRYEENQGWGGCYCTFYDDVRSEDEVKASKDKRGENREARRKTIQDGRASGLLAYVDGKAVGWCNVRSRGGFANLRHLALAVNTGEDVGAITCFLVLQGYRGQGIAKRLLESACELVRGWGMSVVEAYPRRPDLPLNEHEIPGENLSFKGSLSMYEKAGFEVHKKLERLYVVRKRL